jgi:hypothetical protein
MLYHYRIFTSFFCLVPYLLFAQVGINTTTPTAELEIVTTNSSGATKAFSIVNSSGTVLLTVTNNGEVRVNSLAAGGQVVADNTGKLQIGTTTYSPGDIKNSILTADHQGWIKLDGRAVTAFTTTQRAQLNTLGFTTNIPNATNTVLMQSAQPVGTVSGSMQKNITQANLPNINFPTATTSTAGNHSHGNNASGAPGNYGLIFRSSPGQNNTVRDTDSGGSGSEPNITGTPGALAIYNAGDHNHTVTVSSGGSNTPLDVTPRTLSVNVFMYVGN